MILHTTHILQRPPSVNQPVDNAYPPTPTLRQLSRGPVSRSVAPSSSSSHPKSIIPLALSRRGGLSVVEISPCPRPKETSDSTTPQPSPSPQTACLLEVPARGHACTWHARSKTSRLASGAIFLHPLPLVCSFFFFFRPNPVSGLRFAGLRVKATPTFPRNPLNFKKIY